MISIFLSFLNIKTTRPLFKRNSAEIARKQETRNFKYFSKINLRKHSIGKKNKKNLHVSYTSMPMRIAIKPKSFDVEHIPFLIWKARGYVRKCYDTAFPNQANKSLPPSEIKGWERGCLTSDVSPRQKFFVSVLFIGAFLYKDMCSVCTDLRMSDVFRSQVKEFEKR